MSSQTAGAGEAGGAASTPNKRQSTILSSGFSASVQGLRDATSTSAQNFISDLIATSLPSQSVDGAKASLSLRTTTLQFTRFVHKAGPVFAIQDAIESVFRWQDPVLTLLVGCIWAMVCLYPQLILLLPSAALSALLLYNHSRRFPPEPISMDNPYQESVTTKPPPSGEPPTQGSVDYFQNLQNIQELMGRIADLTDAGRQIVPYFNWSDRHFSLVLLQLSSITFIITAVLLFFCHSRLDMRYVFLAAGELSLLASHPLSISMLQDVSKAPSTKLELIKLKALGTQILHDDALSDDILLPNKQGEARTIKEIVVYENERRSLDGSWSTDVLKLEDWKPWQVMLDDQEHLSSKATSSATRNFSASVSSNRSDESSTSPSRETVRFETIVPPKGYAWIPDEDWQIDRIGEWTANKFAGIWNGPGKPGLVDIDGWACVDADGHLLPPPLESGGSVSSAAMRTRRWFKRIVSTPSYSSG